VFDQGEEVLLDGGSQLFGEGEEVLLDGGESLLLGEGEKRRMSHYCSVKGRECHG